MQKSAARACTRPVGIGQMLRGVPESAKNLTSVRGLTMAAMLTALAIVLGYLKIPLSQDNRISFGFIAIASAGFLLGPVPAAVMAMAADVLSYILNPSGGAFFPGFTLTSGLSGIIFGFFLYKQPASRLWLTAIIAVFVNTFFVNIILNTYMLSIMYQKSMQIFKYARIVKNLIQFPVHAVLIISVTNALDRFGVRRRFEQGLRRR